VPSPDLKCYFIFCFESRSGVFVCLVLDLCTGPKVIFFSRRRCVSGTGSFTGLIFAWSLSQSCSQSGQRPRVLPPRGRSHSQLMSRSQAQIHFLTDFSMPWFVVHSPGRARCRPIAPACSRSLTDSVLLTPVSLPVHHLRCLVLPPPVCVATLGSASSSFSNQQIVFN
jgi:hypothetical protein